MTLALGFFDGVHLGHQAILTGADVALTFENHPLSVLAPSRAPRLIMSWAERARAIAALGVNVTALEFNADLAGWSPEKFLDYLRGFAAARGWRAGDPLSVRCGANWRFGRGGAGDAAWLTAHGVHAEVIPYAEYQGAPISSTRIRGELEAGGIAAAVAMLGHSFALVGRRVPGKALGRRLGFPTVNLCLRPDAPRLRFGVYEIVADGVKAVANFGVAPTCGEEAWNEPVLEIHFPPDWSDTHRGMMNVEFRRFIRPERKFASVAELQAAIAADVATVFGDV